MNRTKIIVLILAAIVAILATGVGIGYWLGKPAKVVETYAPEVRQADGSIIAERKPDRKAKPKQQIPKGATVERTGEITVQGPTPEANLKFPGAVPCPPVSIDTTLIREPDGSRRVIVSSPDGRVTRALDIPIETAAAAETHQWAAGLSYDPAKRTPGIWLDRDIGRLRIGAEINQTRPLNSQPIAVEARLRFGFTF